MAKETRRELPPGTLETYSTMHRWLQRGLFVCLTALVIEATATVPGLLIWMGWPTLSPLEICSELTKVRYSDDDFECQFPYPLFEASEAAGQKTAQDVWGVQPKPLYKRVGFRDLVRFRDERLARQAAGRATAGRARPSGDADAE